MNAQVMFSSKTDLWSTPQSFFDKLNKEFNFTLDPCTNGKNAKCKYYFDITKGEDGLTRDWSFHTVFCNPPYGREIVKWVEKAYVSSKVSNTKVVMLLPARTDTRWFHDFIYGKAEIRFLKGRLKFGDSKNTAPFQSMVVIYGGGK